MLSASFYGTKRLKRLARATQKLIKTIYVVKPLCLSAHAQTHANIQACRTCAILFGSAPSGEGMQAQEDMAKCYSCCTCMLGNISVCHLASQRRKRFMWVLWLLTTGTSEIVHKLIHEVNVLRRALGTSHCKWDKNFWVVVISDFLKKPAVSS